MRHSWADVPVGTTFELSNEKRWAGPEARTTTTTTRMKLLARDEGGATVEMTVTGGLAPPHVARATLPLSALPAVGAPGVRLVPLGEEVVEVPAGRYACTGYRVEIESAGAALSAESWLGDGLPVPVVSVHRAAHVLITSRLCAVTAPA